ncbi:MAG: exodeoxyribonuclease V subunit alpha [Rhodanobacter sp.]
MNAGSATGGNGGNAAAGGYHFHPLPIDATAPEAWRALDRAVARWVVIHGGSPLLALVAGWASLAEGHGDSALPLTGTDSSRHGMAALDTEARAALELEAMVWVVRNGQSAPAATPFVIEHEHFYLRRNFCHEVAVAQYLNARRMARLPAGQASAADLAILFQGSTGVDAQAQRDAVIGVLGRRLFVLTGGPGTGKTATVLRMLLMLIKDAAARGMPAPVIRLGAPTGNAAQRLSESLRDGAKVLRERADQPLPIAWQTHLDAALGTDASTLHRLLGSRGHSGGFRYHRDDRLPADIVVVDEASMVDLALLRALLDALRDDAALILVGDADQLTSVGTGSVLLDLVRALEADDAPELVRLQHSFRADHYLVPINQAILRGDAVAFAAAWQAAGSHAVQRSVATTQDLRRVLGPWCRALRQSLEDSGAYAAVPPEREDLVLTALNGLRARQLLCALRESEFGATEVNALIERTLSSRNDDYAGALWYPGRAVMITRNDAAAGLFNGDVGICLLDTDGQLRVWFEVTVARAATPSPGTPVAVESVSSHRSVRAFAPNSLPEHQGAFAVTIHKSQGSEYGHVALLLPPEADNRILSRQLLYTGASRARDVVEVWGTSAALAAAIATPVLRAGGLQHRLRVAAP